MSEPTFTIRLSDLKTLANAVCDLDSFKPPRDARMAERVTRAHDAIMRTLGDQVALVYAPDDAPEKVPA